ncbi:MAG: glycosyltransferase family 25 protein [Paracoccaceae bacterium]
MPWRSYVINLADNTVRMANAAAALDRFGLPWKRIDAVNGWKLPPAEVARVYDAKANAARARAPLVGAEIGCYLSHIEAWRRIAEGPAPGGFVFEDDFAATDALGEVIAALSADSGSDWDMVKLFSLDPSPRALTGRPLGKTHRLILPERVPTCLTGYGLTRAAAARLAARAVPFFRPVDEDQKFFWETGLRVALVTPQPVGLGDQQAATGTIGTARRKAAAALKGGLLHRLRYQLSYRLALSRANRARRAALGAKR